MARKARKKASTGIYHVMLRGINRQNVFLDDEDFRSMIKTQREAQVVKAHDGSIVADDCCTYYAYCLLHNHAHILVREGSISVSELMKRIEDRFVGIYNRKYERAGHLFQDRFASEPVDDAAYFYQLLRYIHRNPVKAMECARPEDYDYSSWSEYLDTRNHNWVHKPIDGDEKIKYKAGPICDVPTVVKRFGFNELVEWVNQDVEDKCMDMDSFCQPMSERELMERLKEMSDVDSIEDFKQLSPEWQMKFIKPLHEQGASLRQLARMSSLSYKALWNRLHPEQYEEEEKRKQAQRKLQNKSNKPQ